MIINTLSQTALALFLSLFHILILILISRYQTFEGFNNDNDSISILGPQTRPLI